MSEARVVPFEQLRMTDVAHVGGKNASLGEMISQLAGVGIRVPGGFATTALPTANFSSMKVWLNASSRAWRSSTPTT